MSRSKNTSTIYITGWAWFIWSCLVRQLNDSGYDNIVIVDHLGEMTKRQNLVHKAYRFYYEKEQFLDAVTDDDIIKADDVVIHLWACSSTTETDASYLMSNNSHYSWSLYKQCKQVWAQLIYASSAATYGDWSAWYNDATTDLSPLNMYGYSKHLFDQRIRRDTENFTHNQSQVVWLKFFNVYGPNEYHKGKMSSVVYHGFHQLEASGEIKLFTSHKQWYADGKQMRDFVYVKDVVKYIQHFMEHKNISGIYNVWSWTARTFYDLAVATCKALGKEPKISFIPMPEHLRDKYQYFTEASMDSTTISDYTIPFHSLEEWVHDYVTHHLSQWYSFF